MEYFGAVMLALWLGVLTSISPCPLATNIAAISIGRIRVRLFMSGYPLWILGSHAAPENMALGRRTCTCRRRVQSPPVTGLSR